MSGIVKKLLIFAGVEGLILQPVAQRERRAPSAIRITYKDNSIAPALKDTAVDEEGSAKSFEAYGIIGLLTFAQSSFLISITRRQQVAQIQGKPIYVVTEVALTPLNSKAEADSSISHTRLSLSRRDEGDGLDYSDPDEDDGGRSAAVSDDVDDDNDQVPLHTSSGSGEHRRTNSIAEDVIARKGGYGRFAQQWFSKAGWTVGQRRNLGMSNSEFDTKTVEIEPPSQPAVHAADVLASDADTKSKIAIKSPTGNDVTVQLLPKLLRTSSILFGSSQSFYFSYDWDLTRSFATRDPTKSEMPDALYFWNRHLIQPFVDAGQSSFVLPMIQGFVGQRMFEMDTSPPLPLIGSESTEKVSLKMVDFPQANQLDRSDASKGPDGLDFRAPSTKKTFSLTLISRRSVKRAGLRYLRRGINDEGDTANTVETEQVLSDADWSNARKVHSFVQLRGSIPIYFSQSPYSFRPVPQLQHSEESNYHAFLQHFTGLNSRYGEVQIASLVEKHGNEAIVGNEYEKYFNRLRETENGSHFSGEFWDFHSLCKGMRFENVGLLLGLLEKKMNTFGDTVVVNNQRLKRQSGVLRTNCMDCLDRTNVVQSAAGKRTLEQQLKDEGIDMSIQVDQGTQWFNDLWADNGDALSRAYASTSAMKGDFTRTGKRDFQGALKDMGISISRFYSGIVNDYFSQVAIDYLLGNVNDEVWQDFEANLMTGDPAMSMQKLRQRAIEMCQKIAVADEREEFMGGWTLLTPQASNSIKSSPIEESVLLLTDAALYSCRLDWSADKVSSFERVDLQHIKSIKYGTYITSTLSSSHTDEERNVGFVVTYRPGAHDIRRVNSRALANVRPRDETDLLDGSATSPAHTPAPASDPFQTLPTSQAETRVLAFKAISARSAVASETLAGLSEIEQVKTICGDIERIALQGRISGPDDGKKSLVEAGAIITLAEARRSTGLLEQLSHRVKKLVWA